MQSFVYTAPRPAPAPALARRPGAGSRPALMRVVGLTGGIASGKSTVSAMFRELGAEVIDADQVAREVVEPGTPGLEEVARRFPGVVDAAGHGWTGRRSGARVFADRDRARRAGRHRPSRGSARRWRRQDRGARPRRACTVVLYDAALLIENGLHRGMEGVIARLGARGGAAGPARGARRAGRARRSPRASRRSCPWPTSGRTPPGWWTTAGSLDETRAQVRRFWEADPAGAAKVHPRPMSSERRRHAGHRLPRASSASGWWSTSRRRARARIYALVQPRLLEEARRTLAARVRGAPVEVLAGDVTDLHLGPLRRGGGARRRERDPHLPPRGAQPADASRGTWPGASTWTARATCWSWRGSAARLERLVHFSTCHVAGAREGVIAEDELDRGQEFRNA